MDTLDARPRGLWVLVQGYRITKMAKHKTQYNNRTWHSLGRELGRCVPLAALKLAHLWASAVAWTASGVSRYTGHKRELFFGSMLIKL